MLTNYAILGAGADGGAGAVFLLTLKEATYSYVINIRFGKLNVF